MTQIVYNDSLSRVQVKFSRAASQAPQIFLAALERVSTELVRYVKTQKIHGQVLHQRSGKLSRSIDSRVTSEGGLIEGIVGSIKGGAPHALPLEVGSKPHIIRPVRAKALHFMGLNADGEVTDIFRRSVMHPGNKPYRYLQSSLQENRAHIVHALSNAGMKGITK